MASFKQKLIVSDSYRAKNKTSYFAFHQLIKRLPEFNIEFHALWDDPNYKDEWSDKFDSLDCKIVPYTKEQLNEYCLSLGAEQDYIDNKFPKFKAIYILLLAHYLRKINKFDYYLIYDDDVIIKENISELKHALKEKLPCLLVEPMNASCDKSLLPSISNWRPGSADRYRQVNPHSIGFNAGFMGIRLEIYDAFLDSESFNQLLNMFNYRGINDEDGKEIVGPERTLIDTQQQSFFSIMNQTCTTKSPYMLPYPKYHCSSNWGTHPTYGTLDPENEYGGWDVAMKSEIVHFIGHTVLNGKHYGKPKYYHKLVNEYLKENELI